MVEQDEFELSDDLVKVSKPSRGVEQTIPLVRVPSAPPNNPLFFAFSAEESKIELL